jgi:hypothetical protein
MDYVLTYGDTNFIKSRERAFNSIKNYVDNVLVFTEKNLEKYKSLYPYILYNGARGGGFWLYKSIFLKETFNKCENGDMIIWMDSGVEFTGNKDDITILKNIALNNDGFCLFKQINRNRIWTKRDAFVYMDCDKEEYYNALQCDAAIQIYIKNEKTLKFINELLFYCGDYRIITDSPNQCGLPNLYGVRDHRHDQSILTNLSIKYGLQRFKQPTQYGEIDWCVDNEIENFTDYERSESSKYKIIFNHHRERQ